VGTAARQARAGDLTPAERDSALKQLQSAPRIIRPILTRAIQDPKGFQRSMLETLPRVLFALVPIFAAILTLFYRHRKYPEHLYFGLHIHAFFFVALTVAAAAKFSHSYAVSGVAAALVALWIIGYALVAAKRVYGGSWPATVTKGFAVTVIYSIAGLAGLLVAVLIAAMS
jgi:hypothetical protein